MAVIDSTMVIFVDRDRRVALVQLPHDAVPGSCRPNKEYQANIVIGNEPHRIERRVYFILVPENSSYGHHIPSLAWAFIVEIDRDDQIVGRAYQLRCVTLAAPADLEEVRNTLVGFRPPIHGLN